MRKKPFAAARANVHNGCACALQVGAVVEIANQDVTLNQVPDRGRHLRNTIRVYITDGWNCGCNGVDVIQSAEKRSLRLGYSECDGDYD
jgi:hypothetical protein